MEQTIEVRYAGVVIGRATSLADPDASGVFLGLGDPMPVGTTVSIQVAGDVVDGRVEQVAESADPVKCGMRIRFDDPSALSLFGVPGAPPRAARPAAASPAVTPTGANVNLASAQAASSSDAASDASGDGADGDGDRGPAPDAAGSGADSGGQAGGGGRRRRRRR